MFCINYFLRRIFHHNIDSLTSRAPIVLTRNIVEKPAFDNLCHQSMNNFNGCFARVFRCFRQFIFAFLLMRVASNNYTTPSQGIFRLF